MTQSTRHYLCIAFIISHVQQRLLWNMQCSLLLSPSSLFWWMAFCYTGQRQVSIVGSWNRKYLLLFWNGLVACSLMSIVSLEFFLWGSLHISHVLTMFSVSLLIPLQYTLFLALNRYVSTPSCVLWILFRTMLFILFGITRHSPLVANSFCTERHSFIDS